MYFPTAGIETHPLLPPLVSFAISLITSMGGVSGAFMLLPFQMSVLGYVSPSVSATNHLYNIVAIPGGVFRYIREGRMVWPLALAVILGTLPGVFAGAVIRVRYLPDPGHFKFFAALVLLYIGLRMARNIFASRGADKTPSADTDNRVTPLAFTARSIAYRFGGREYRASTRSVFVMSLAVGVVGGTYGIGGGSIIAPFFVAFLGLPVHTVAGAALLGTFVTSIAGTIFFQAIAPLYPDMAVAPDWRLGLLFGLGGLFGTYCGARLQKHVRPNLIKAILVACILVVAVRYIMDFIRA
jgi:uncharacterized membrane protein YfcA